MNITQTVSENVKHIREQNKLTLDTAAALTGVSRSMLAQIERGEVNPTISVVWKIANGFKVSFTSLVEPAREHPTLIRAADTTPISEDCGRYCNYPAFPFDEELLFETYRIVIAPGGELQAQPHLPKTEEFITVFSGQVEITAGEEHFLLATGDSLRFPADQPHRYQNTGECEATLSMLIRYAG